MQGILWANLSLWTRVVLITRRVLPLRCTRRARYVGRWHLHTRLGFRPRRFVLWSILTRGTRVGRSWWTYAVPRNRVRCSGVAGRYDSAPTEFRPLPTGHHW